MVTVACSETASVPSSTVSVNVTSTSASTAGAVNEEVTVSASNSVMGSDELCVQRYLNCSSSMSATVPERMAVCPPTTVRSASILTVGGVLT